jgi:hypothetical protein
MLSRRVLVTLTVTQVFVHKQTDKQFRNSKMGAFQLFKFQVLGEIVTTEIQFYSSSVPLNAAPHPATSIIFGARARSAVAAASHTYFREFPQPTSRVITIFAFARLIFLQICAVPGVLSP